jgi:hypothetical protein
MASIFGLGTVDIHSWHVELNLWGHTESQPWHGDGQRKQADWKTPLGKAGGRIPSSSWKTLVRSKMANTEGVHS